MDTLSCAVNGHTVLSDVQLQVPGGAMDFIVGPSGAGKTSLLRCIAGLMPFQSGKIVIAGATFLSNTTDWRLRSLETRRNLGFVFQDARLFEHLTVSDNIAMGLYVQGRTREAVAPMIKEHASLFGLTRLLTRRCSALSGGERQRVALCRAVILKPSILLLDEITSGLDVIASGDLMEAVLATLSPNRSLLAVSHQIQFAIRHARTIHFMDQGRFSWSGSPSEFMISSNPNIASFVSTIKRGW